MSLFGQVLLGIFLVSIVIGLLYPYYSLIGIYQSIDKLTEELHKLREDLKNK